MAPFTHATFLKKISPNLIVYALIFLFITFKRPPLWIELAMIVLVLWGISRAIRQTLLDLYQQELDRLARERRLSPQAIAKLTGLPVNFFAYSPQGNLTYTKKNRKQLQSIVAQLTQPKKES